MTNRPPGCKAHVLGGQWFCDECGVTWDIDDDDPPECGETIPVVNVGTPGHVDHGTPSRDKEKAAKAVDNMRGILKK